MQLKSLLREPLLHFVAIGAALFLYFHFSAGGGAGPGSTRIVLTSGQIAHLEAGFARTWQRPPTEAELKNLLDEWVREEIAVREAMAAGLDRDDTVIRRRLRQKLEFLVEDAADAPPTDDELKAWFAQNADAFRAEPRLAFRQVFLSRDKRGAAAEAEAARLLAWLNAAGAFVKIEQLGDATMLPGEVGLAPLRDIDRQFGSGFGRQLEPLATGTWAGPVRSGYGLHLVLVTERTEGKAPDFAVIRSIAEREFIAERHKRQLAAMYDRLLEKYRVVVENSPARQASAAHPAQK